MTDLKRERALIDELYAGDKGLFYWNDEDIRRIAKALAAARRAALRAALPAEPPEWFLTLYSRYTSYQGAPRFWADLRANLLGEDVWPSSELHALTKERDEVRDEIVELREFKARVFADVRAEALEEAARLCERIPGDPKHGDFFAAAIRTLKDKRHD